MKCLFAPHFAHPRRAGRGDGGDHQWPPRITLAQAGDQGCRRSDLTDRHGMHPQRPAYATAAGEAAEELVPAPEIVALRSEERRVGIGVDRNDSYRWAPYQ